jgi:hypothetical protein
MPLNLIARNRLPDYLITDNPQKLPKQHKNGIRKAKSLGIFHLHF